MSTEQCVMENRNVIIFFLLKQFTKLNPGLMFYHLLSLDAPPLFFVSLCDGKNDKSFCFVVK